MENARFCSKFLDEDYDHYVIEYRGEFKQEIDRVDYACGEKITDTLGVVAIRSQDIDRLIKDVPSIVFMEPRSVYILQQVDPSNTSDINAIKENPYLDLTGRGVLVGLIDTGINYLNEEFIREDSTSRIISIWDQSIQDEVNREEYIGTVYSNEEINKAIEAHNKGEDSYAIVPSKDEVDHGTKMAGIIGARGYNGQFQGIANDCEFVVVKLLESPSYKKILRENNLKEVPVYDNSEVLAAIEYLRKVQENLNRPMVIYIGVGSCEGSHDGNNITSRFITSIASGVGFVFVSGTGNSANSETHTTGYIKNVGEIHTIEINISREIKVFNFYVWIHKPDRMLLNIIDPTGEEMDFIIPTIYSVEEKNFYFLNTHVKVRCYDPENYTGHQAYFIYFTSIKKGIWKLQLKGSYITSGRYDIWLQDKSLLPEGTKLLEPNIYTTLTIPSTARRVITVACYDTKNNAVCPSSGRGFNTNNLINPDIAAPGINILTTSGSDNKVVTVSGSSASTAVVAGVCCILIQWLVLKNQYTSLNSTELRSLLIYGADRDNLYNYPNEDMGYGRLNLLGVFNTLGGKYRNKEMYHEYYVNNLFIRYPLIK